MEEKKVMALFVPVTAFALLVTSFSAYQINDISCVEAISSLAPCRSYIEGSGPDQPPADCCSGVKTVLQRANSTESRRDVCKCLKDAAGQIHYDPGRAQKLPQYCKVTLPFPLSPDVNCSNIPF